MRFLLYISRFMIPLVIVYMITFGLLMKRPVYDDFAGYWNGLLDFLLPWRRKQESRPS